MIQFLKIRDVKSPERWTKLSSGIDFFIPNDLKVWDIKRTPLENNIWMEVPIYEWEILIPVNEGVLIPSWIKTIIKPWFDLVFDNKSWVASKKWLIIWAKVVDSDYRWEVHIHLINTTNYTQKIKLWDKVAQAIIRKVELIEPYEITQEEFEKQRNTERGEGWFWSTGTK